MGTLHRDNMAETIVDTSSILFGIGNRKDVFAAVSIAFPSSRISISKGVMAELKGISHNMGKRGKEAKTSLELLKRKYKNIKVYDNSTNVDQWILGKALADADCVVVTNDTALSKQIKSKGIRCLKLTRSGLLR